MKRLFLSALVAVGLLVLCQPQAVAQGGQTVFERERLFDDGLTEVSLGLELFRWQEFNSSDTRLLTEQGPRARIRFSHSNETRVSSGVIYRLDGSLYGGDVEYDGQSQPGGHFSAADVDYTGVTGEAWGGYRLVNSPLGQSVDFLVGVGIDSWTRDIGSGVNSQGNSVGGLVEDYKIAFTRFSLGGHHRAEFWKNLWRLGVKYPVFTKETLDIPSVDLDPGKEPSVFFSYRFQLMNWQGLDKGTFIVFVYDSFRFSKSPAVPAGDFLVHQPKSSMDTLSLSIGRVF